MTKKIFIGDYIQTFNNFLEKLDEEIERKKKERESGIRSLLSIRRDALLLKKQVPKITKRMVSTATTKAAASVEGVPSDVAVETSTTSTCAFNQECSVSPELAKYLKLNKNFKAKRCDIIKLVFEMRRTGEEAETQLQILLGYDDYKERVKNGEVFKNALHKETGIKHRVKVDDDALFFWVVNRLLSPHIFSVEKSSVEKSSVQ